MQPMGYLGLFLGALLLSASLAAPLAKTDILQATSAEKMGDLKKAHVVHSGPAAVSQALEDAESANSTATTADAVGFFCHRAVCCRVSVSQSIHGSCT
jgi:hypothetical protein